MVDLRECKAGDKLLSKHGWILEYVKPLPEGNYMDHEVKYPDGSNGSRTHDGFVYRKKRLETDHDIIQIIKKPIMETTITYITDDESIEIKLQYIAKQRLHIYSKQGKVYPKHTQCLMFKNGLLVGYGEVIKHNNDIDNPEFAFKEATRKVMDKINIKFIREELWAKVLAEIKDGSLSNKIWLVNQ